MAELRQYVISVVTAAIICGLVLGLAPKGSVQGILKILCGVFLTLMVIEPVTRMDLRELVSGFVLSYSEEADAAAAFGEEIAEDSRRAYIKQETEAYILDKAAGLGLTPEVDVTLSIHDPPVPVAVTFRGEISFHTKQQLEQILTEELDISKENLQWIG